MEIEIRPYKPDDAESHCDAVKASIERLKTWFSWATPNYCLCDSIEFVQSQPNREKAGKYAFAIINIADRKFLGNCGLNIIKTYNGDRVATMSYWRRQDSEKRRFMWQAAGKLRDFAFNELGIKRIEIDVAWCNKASICVAKTIGAKPERDIPILGGDGKVHEGTKYVLIKSNDNIE